MTREEVNEMIRTRTDWLGNHVNENAGENIKEDIPNDDRGSIEKSSETDKNVLKRSDIL